MQRRETYLCSEERRRRRWRGDSFLLFPGVAPLSLGFFFICRREMVASLFFFPFLFSFSPLELCLGRKKNFRSLLSNSPTLDEDYDAKDPGTGAWLDRSFLGFVALVLPLFLLWFSSGFRVFLPCFCLRFSLPASVFFPGFALFFSLVFGSNSPLFCLSVSPCSSPLFSPCSSHSVRYC